MQAIYLFIPMASPCANGVTTIVDAGSSGWRNFADFKDKVIDRSKTRVLAELNIVGAGMRGSKYEDNLDDMDGKLTGEQARQFPGVIVGVKSAHFTGPEWKPYDQAVIAGNLANIPVMIDYGARRIERPLLELMACRREFVTTDAARRVGVLPADRLSIG